MEIIYYIVRHSSCWESDYHENFFNVQGAFLWGLIAALIIGILVAAIFYFGFCCSKKSSKYATISGWIISMVVAAVLGYFCADLVKMNPKDEGTPFWVYSFCKANVDYHFVATNGESDQTYVDDLSIKMDEIKDDLHNYKDVRFGYDITTAVLAVLFFFITSLIVKRFTINGRTIPFLKP